MSLIWAYLILGLALLTILLNVMRKITSTEKKTPAKHSKSHVEADSMAESNLHPEKLSISYSKFSEMRESLDEDRMSIGRLVLYIVIVIIIGVALTLGVQAFIRYQNEQALKSDTASNPIVLSDPVITYITINNSVVADSQATPVAPTAEQLTDKSATIGTEITSSTTVAAWDRFSYDRYTSFERIQLTFTANVNQPKTTVSYNSTDKIIYIDIDKVGTDRSELKGGKEIAKLTGTNVVKSVQNSSTTADKLRISVYLNEAAKYYARFINNELVLDVREADFVATSTTSTSSAAATTTTSASATSADNSGKPAAPFYDNSYSKKTQYISSTYTGNKLRIWNYTYRDYGDRYEFKFRIKDDGSGVNPMIPNAKAYLNTDAADPQLTVEISNVNWEILNKTNAECFEGVGFGNVKKICGKFDAATSTATYTFSLNKLADFEMDTIENSTVDASRPGQVVWLKIKDN